MGRSDELHDLEGLIIQETDKAYLIAVDNDSEDEHWFPKSQLKQVHVKGDDITCECPEWLLDEKGLL